MREAISSLQQGNYFQAGMNSLLPLLYLSLIEEGESLMSNGYSRIFRKRKYAL